MPEGMDKINKRIGRLYNIADKNLDRYTKGIEGKIITGYKDALDEIRLLLGQMYEKFGDDVTYAKMATYQRLVNMENEFTARLLKAGHKARRATEKAIIDTYSQSYYSTGYIHESTLNVGMGFTAVDENVLRSALINPYTSINWPERLSKNTSYLIGQVKDNVTRGLRQGYGYAKTARLMKDSIERGTYESMRIVWTESHRVKNNARQVGYDKVIDYCEEENIDLEKVWLSTLDHRTRPSHRSMDGQVADKEGFFYLPGNVKTESPGNSGVAKEDIYCRCTFISRILDIPYQFRYDNIEKRRIKWTNYDDWYEKKIALKKAA